MRLIAGSTPFPILADLAVFRRNESELRKEIEARVVLSRLDDHTTVQHSKGHIEIAVEIRFHNRNSRVRLANSVDREA